MYDNIVPSTEGVLCEWSYVDKGIEINRPCDLMRHFPYVKKGWYHRCLVEYLFERGLSGLGPGLKWEHIKFSFQPTTLLPADAFKLPVEKIVSAWMSIPEARAGADHPDLAKASINAAIGSLICRDQTFTYTCRTTGKMNADVPNSHKHRLPSIKVGGENE